MNLKRITISIVIGICLAVGLYTLNFARAKQKPATYQSNQAVPYTQAVTSCVKDIRVIKAEVVNASTVSARIEVWVENLSDLGIIAISLEATDGVSLYTTTKRGSFTTDKQLVVIKPHESTNLTLSSPFGDVPLRIGGVFYEDGSEAGCNSSLKTLNEVKESERSQRTPNEKDNHNPQPDKR